jgi:hypothetical protein
MVTWKQLIEASLKRYEDTLVCAYAEDSTYDMGAEEDKPVTFTTATNHLNIPGLLVQFDSGYGGTRGPLFTVWGEKRVYFPAQYDGSEWVGSVPRNPCEQVTNHVGGG